MLDLLWFGLLCYVLAVLVGWLLRRISTEYPCKAGEVSGGRRAMGERSACRPVASWMPVVRERSRARLAFDEIWGDVRGLLTWFPLPRRVWAAGRWE